MSTTRCVGLVALVFLVSAPAGAEEAVPALAAPEEAVAAEATKEAPAPAVDAGTPTPAFLSKVELGKGLTISRGDALSLTLKGRVAVRDQVAVAKGVATNEPSLRTVRLVLQGNALTPALTYSIQLAMGAADYDSAAGVLSPIYDAYLDWAAVRELKLRVGQFFVPFDRARTIREYALEFADRQQVVSELTLDRDIGLMAYSDDVFGWGGRLAYAFGVFGGQGKDRVVATRDPGFLWVGRLAIRPMGPFDDDVEGDLKRSVTPHLALGVAAAYNGNTSRQRSTTGNVFTLGGYYYRHYDADLVFKYRGFSFLGEWLYRTANRDLHEAIVSGKVVDEYSRSGWGYTLQASYMITDFLQVAARWNQLRFIGTTDPLLIQTVAQQGREVTGAVNLYFNGHLFKLQADYTARLGEGTAPLSHLVRVLIDLSI